MVIVEALSLQCSDDEDSELVVTCFLEALILPIVLSLVGLVGQFVYTAGVGPCIRKKLVWKVKDYGTVLKNVNQPTFWS